MTEQNNNPRRLALDSLLAWEKCGKYTNLEVDAGLRRSRMQEADRALYTRLVYGVCERRITLDYWIDRYAKSVCAAEMEPYPRMVLRLGLYQLAFLDRVPAHAAVHETVALASARHRGFVNAVLRAFLRDDKAVSYPPETEEVSYLSVRYSFPPETVASLLADYGRERTEETLAASLTEGYVTLRKNPLRETDAALPDCVPVPEIPGMWRTRGHSLPETLREAIVQGDCFVQDGASRLCTLAIGAVAGERIVDTCACPGGKTFSMALDMRDRGEIFAMDIHANKLSLVEKTASRLGLTCVHAVCRDARNPDPALVGTADRVLCDAPCSGLGVAAKKPDIRYKSMAEAAGLPRIQKAVLQGASAYVKPGGVLVYSTCTLRKAENEEVAADFLAGHPEFVPDPFRLPGRDMAAMITLFPQTENADGAATDGFFIARFRRVDSV